MHHYTQRSVITALVEDFTGYGHIFTEVFSSLEMRGVYCAVRALGTDERFGIKIPLEVKSHFVSSIQPEAWELLIRPPIVAPTPGRKTAWLTMYESTRLPKLALELVNKAHIVIVPSKWNKDGFIKSGVTRPIHVIPLGFDPAIFQPEPIPKSGPVVFGVAGRVGHGPVRKGIGRAIELFQKAFPADKNVRLHVKVHPDCEVQVINDDRIKIVKAHLEWYQLANWFKEVHCFVSLAKAEGFGLMQLQAIASGRKVVAARYGGMTEFLSGENCIPIKFKEEKAEKEGDGKWAVMMDKSVIEAFHVARAQVVKTDIQRVAASVTKFHWKNFHDSLLILLQKTGVVTNVQNL